MKFAHAVTAAIALVATQAIAQNPTRPGVTLAAKLRAMPPMPTVAVGAPQPWSGPSVSTAARWNLRTVSATVSGRTVSGSVIEIHGLDGIEKAPGIPDGARRLLEMHVRTLRPGQSTTYIVNTQLAASWIAAHPVPPDVKPADGGGDSHSGCDKWSTHCFGEVVKHAEGQLDQLVQQAVDAWNHASGELSHDWNLAEACFADSTLRFRDVPITFSRTPSFGVHLEQSGSTNVAGGVASGTVQGTLNLGFPIDADFRAEIDVFYIPCLPFAIRPKSIAGGGTLTVAEQLKGDASASGRFDRLFTIPPTGGPQIPIEVIPIIVGDVPVAELDVSAYIEGNVQLSATGKVDGSFVFTDPHKANFEFQCSGDGCSARALSLPDPITTTESASIKGQVSIKPAIFTALQLDFDVSVLSARAGPQPYLLGTASGCDAATATQTVGAASTSSENHILAADLDWGVDLRAEALAARVVIGNKYQHSVTGNKHLWFGDLLPGGSTSLIANVSGPTATSAKIPTLYKVRMPSCYPYTNTVKYRVTWTGNATPAPVSSCQWQAGQGTCSFDPTKELTFTLNWPAAGSFTVSVVPMSDDHNRVFSPPPKPGQVAVSVH